MKKITAAFLFVLTACTTTNNPVLEPRSTALSVIPTQALPTSTAEIIIPTIAFTSEIAPTSELINQRTSPVDGMPQVYIPAGTFHMGGMDVRRAPNEIPDHDVQLDAYWMDQIEVTNAMYALCVNVGGCTPPQDFKSQRRPSYFNNPEFNDYPVI